MKKYLALHELNQIVAVFLASRGLEFNSWITVDDLRKSNWFGIEMDVSISSSSMWSIVYNTKHLLEHLAIIVEFADREDIEKVAIVAFNNISEYDRNRIFMTEISKDYSSLAFQQFSKEFKKTLIECLREGVVNPSKDIPLEDIMLLDVDIFSFETSKALKKNNIESFFDLYEYIKDNGIKSLLKVRNFRSICLEEIKAFLSLYKISFESE